MSKLEETLREARLVALSRRGQPYTATALYACKMLLIEAEVADALGIPVAAITENGVILWNKREVENLADKPEPLGAICLHEVWHLLRAHEERVGSRDRKLFNLAADLEINDDLIQVSIAKSISSSLVTPQTFRLDPGKTAEEYYDQLKKQQIKLPVNIAYSPIPTSSLPEELRREVGAKGLNEGKKQAVAKAVAQEIASRPAGTVPLGLRRWAKRILQPRVPWTKILRDTLATGTGWGYQDFTFRRPSKRSEDILLPSLRQGRVEVGFVIDTSGSIQEHELEQAVTEVLRIIDELGLEPIVIACDASAYAISLKALRRGELEGGGGTDMREGLEELNRRARKRGVRLQAVVLTDGYTPYPSAKEVRNWVHLTRVAWVIWAPAGEGEPPLPPKGTGQVIKIELEEV